MLSQHYNDNAKVRLQNLLMQNHQIELPKQPLNQTNNPEQVTRETFNIQHPYSSYDNNTKKDKIVYPLTNQFAKGITNCKEMTHLKNDSSTIHSNNDDSDTQQSVCHEMTTQLKIDGFAGQLKIDTEKIEELVNQIQRLEETVKILNQEKISANRSLKIYKDQLADLMSLNNLDAIVKNGKEFSLKKLQKK